MNIEFYEESQVRQIFVEKSLCLIRVDFDTFKKRFDFDNTGHDQ